VVLDLMLPGMDGLEICRRIRATPEWSGLPVITIRPTMFLESFFPIAGPTVRDRGRIELPFGRGKTSPVAASDVARGGRCRPG